MACKYSYDDIIKLFENSISIEYAEEIKMHLTTCKKCKCYYESLELANKFVLGEVPLKHGFHNEIMTQIDKSRYSNKKHSIVQIIHKPAIKYTFATIACCLFFIALIINTPKITNYINQGNVILNPINSPDISTTSPNPINYSIPLEFKKADVKQSVEVLDKNAIKKVYIEKDISNGKVFIFLNSNDEEWLHGGFEINNIYYDLGKVAMKLTEEEMETISISEVNFCNIKLLRIFGIMGANFSQTSYYTLYDGKPSTFLIINGSGVEIDLDNDGNKEIVSSSGTAAYTYLYKYEDGYIKESDINQTLGAVAVIFNENSNSFSAYYSDNKNKQKLFKFNGKEMVLLNM